MNAISRVFLLMCLAELVPGFLFRPYKCFKKVRQSNNVSSIVRSMSTNDGGPDGKEGSLEAMRRMLEGSWNADTMGAVPSSPEAAANEVGGSLLTAKDRGCNLLIVNLLLPTYDITQGSSFYDEVEAVSFCVALSRLIKGKTSIVVRDNKTVKTATRVLDAREKAAPAATSSVTFYEQEDNGMEGNDEDEDDNEDDEEEDDDEDDEITSSKEVDVKDNAEDDGKDFGEFGTVGDSRLGDSKKSELMDFRKQLMSEWGSDKSVPGSESNNMPSDSGKKKSKGTTPSTVAKTPGIKNYRITSMFGEASFTRGPDMFDKVIQAVSANGQPREDEDTIIILSAASEEETIGIRALVSKYQQSKTMVLVNCKLEPLPRELIKAETIYTLLPLIAKSKDARSTLDRGYAGTSAQPKVVVMRRYPRDFEVFMDFGNGFELTETASFRNGNGPSMQWIADCVKKQMDARA